MDVIETGCPADTEKNAFVFCPWHRYPYFSVIQFLDKSVGDI